MRITVKILRCSMIEDKRSMIEDKRLLFNVHPAINVWHAIK
jgi:hypothetical protein